MDAEKRCNYRWHAFGLVSTPPLSHSRMSPWLERRAVERSNVERSNVQRNAVERITAEQVGRVSEWPSPPPAERSRAEWSDLPKKRRIGGKRSLAHSPCLLRSTCIAIPGSVCCILLQSAPLHAALLAHLGRISLSEKSWSMSSTFFLCSREIGFSPFCAEVEQQKRLYNPLDKTYIQTNFENSLSNGANQSTLGQVLIEL